MRSPLPPILSALPAAACGAPTSADRPPPATEDPIAALERTLLHPAERRTAAVHIETEGAVEATMDGALVLEPGGRATLRFHGRFAGAPEDPWLELDSERMRGGSTAGEAAFDEPAPEGAVDAIVVGLVRMGLMHNLARLSFDQPPDHADGGVRDWLQARDVRDGQGSIRASVFELREQTAGCMACPTGVQCQCLEDPDILTRERPVRRLDFTVVVDGEPSGEAALFVEDGLPVRREQTVHFDEGDMRVVEEFDWR